MPSNGATEEEQCRKLFIGGLSFDTTDDSLNDYFCKYGTITDCVVIKEPNSGKSKGFGFVTFETEPEADSCMEERPHNLNGRQVDVKRAVSREECLKPGAHVQVKKIFIGGIKRECTEEELKEFFGTFGEVESIEIPYDRETNQQRGFAFVTYTDFDPVDKLVAKRHYEFNGLRCEVKKALSKQEMEKAKYQVEAKQQRYGAERNAGRGGGGYRRGGRGRGGGSGGYGGGYDDYGDGNHYRSGSSNYGPMKSQYGQRSSGPYGGGYGSGGYGSGGYGSGGYGSGGYDNYGSGNYGSDNYDSGNYGADDYKSGGGGYGYTSSNYYDDTGYGGYGQY